LQSSTSSTSSTLSAWLQAARPLAQANIAPPLLVGQALAYAAFGQFSWTRALLAFAFGVIDQLFIVFANDTADVEADRLNKTYNRFSGGSRVVPEGKLSPRSLAHAAFLMVGLLAVFSAYLTLQLRLMWMLILCTCAVGLLWAYSFPPFRLSYRGGGEILQGLGVGVVLPVIGYYLQCGSLTGFPLPALIPLFLLGYAGNIVTSLPDVPGDRAAGKRSLPVRRGQLTARVQCLVVIAAAIAASRLVAPQVSSPTLVALLAAPAVCLCLALTRLKSADATEPASCLRFVMACGAAITLTQLAWAFALFRNA
jgi:1,4-dihydroxy-2-naphthoate octaprenyltransferase